MTRPIAMSLIAIGLFVFTFLQLYSPIHSHPIQQSNRGSPQHVAVPNKPF